MKILTILNDAPYGSERTYNGLRLALSLAKRSEVEQRVFLMADAVGAALIGQKTPDGYYNVERMLGALARAAVPMGACSTCMDARATTDDRLIPGCHRSSLAELTDWTLWADKVITW